MSYPVDSLSSTVHTVISACWPFVAGAVVLLALNSVWDRASFNAKIRRLAEAKKRRIQPPELVADARTLLARAQQAKTTVLESSVHRAGLIDRQRNQVALPHQEWEIAEALREYSRLIEAEPKNPQGSKVAAVLSTRRKALRASRDGVERRVAALEAYADQVTEADDQYRELQQIQQLTDGADDVLDLLASTARHDLAVAEIEGMTGEAAVVASAFSAALASAKEAAVLALPTTAA